MAQMSRYKICIITVMITLIAFACSDLLQAEIRSSDTHTIISDITGTGGTIAIAPNASGYSQTHNYAGQSMSVVSSSTGAYTMYSGFLQPKMKLSNPMVYFDAVTKDVSEDDGAITITLSLADNNTLDYSIWVKCNFSGTATNQSDYVVAGMTGDDIIVNIPSGSKSQTINITLTDDSILEGKETIIASIESITRTSGDSFLNKSLVTKETINISANDIFMIGGNVFYEGSQTGSLIVAAYTDVSIDINADSEVVIKSSPVAYTICSFDVSDTTDSFLINNVSVGTYTVVAFIDSDVGSSVSMQSWEAVGYYTQIVTFANGGTQLETLGATIKLKDPDDRYENQFVNANSTYAEWAAQYSFKSADAMGAYIDTDEDGYSNYDEYINGTDPLTADEPYKYAGYDPTTDETSRASTERYQLVETIPSAPIVYTNGYVMMDIMYDNYDEDGLQDKGLNGLGIAIHYDSSKVAFSGFSNVETDSLAADSVIYPLTPLASDSNSYSWYNGVQDETEIIKDGYQNTDKAIPIAWLAPLNTRAWPGLDAVLPMRLCTVTFKAKTNWTGVSTTVIRFTATSTDARYQFYSSPTTVTVGDFNLDIDSNGRVTALTDGLLVMRYLYGLIEGGAIIQEDAIASDATRKTANEIFAYLNGGESMLDMDGNTEADALTDGLLIIRYLFDLSEGDSLVENAVSVVPPVATRTTSEDIVPYIRQLIPR